MPTSEERRIVEELDREASRKGGLVVLVVCLMAAVALVVTGTMGMLQ